MTGQWGGPWVSAEEDLDSNLGSATFHQHELE